MQAAPALSDNGPKPPGLPEKLILGFIFIFPLSGVFEPIEEYITPSVARNMQSVMYAAPINFGISGKEHVLTVLALFILWALHLRGLTRQLRLLTPVLLLTGWIFASTLWSINPVNTVHRVFHMLDHVMFATYLVYRFKWRDMIGFLTKCYAFILTANIVVMTLLPSYGFSGLEGYGDAWRGVFTEKNALGAGSALGVLTAGYSAVRGINQRWLALFTCIGEYIFLIMSRSATANIALMAALCVATLVVAISAHDRRALRLLAIATIMVGVVELGAYLALNDSLNEAAGRSADLTGRTIIWHYVYKAIQLRPLLGYGYGFWDAVSNEKLNMWASMNWTFPHAHDELLDITLQTGIIGLCLEVLLLAVAVFRFLRLTLVLGDGRALFCGMVLTMLFLRGITETVLTDPATSGWTWIVIPYLVLSQHAKERRDAKLSLSPL